ncbi:MAG: organic solvent tolerance protein OstA, partial [Planctomycetota bacterium]
MASGQSPSDETLRVRGERIRRWSDATAEYRLFQQDCVLEFGRHRIEAKEILVAVDGVDGDIRSRIVIEQAVYSDGRRSQSPVSTTLRTVSEPQWSAPLYLGKPNHVPLMEHLPGQVTPADVRTAAHDHSAGYNRTAGYDHAANGTPTVQRAQFQLPAPTDSAGGSPNALPLETGNPAGSTLPPAGIPVPTPLPESAIPRSALPIAPNGTGNVQPAPALPLDPSTGLPPAAAQSLPQSPFDPAPGATIAPAPNDAFTFTLAGGNRALQLMPRNPSILPVVETLTPPGSPESVVVGRGGLTVMIRDVTAQLPGGDRFALGAISLSADRVVAWIPPTRNLFNQTAQLSQSEGELYLEGDIVFRQGDRIIYADAMYFNIEREVGVILDAEAVTTIDEFQGVVRLKADVMQQVARGNFIAFDAAVTSSRMGVPRYWLQSNQLRLTDRQRIVTDRQTGLPRAEIDPFVTASNSFVYLAGFPVLYWPRFGTRLEQPTFYLTSAKANNDGLFGTQVLLEWDLFQLFGWENPPDGVELRLSTDYLSDRGPAVGISNRYNLASLFGIPGPVIGNSDSWYIDDDGTDTLGGDRRDLVPEETWRGRSFLQHRHYLPNNFQFIAQIG